MLKLCLALHPPTVFKRSTTLIRGTGLVCQGYPQGVVPPIPSCSGASDKARVRAEYRGSHAAEPTTTSLINKLKVRLPTSKPTSHNSYEEAEFLWDSYILIIMSYENKCPDFFMTAIIMMNIFDQLNFVLFTLLFLSFKTHSMKGTEIRSRDVRINRIQMDYENRSFYEQ